MTLVDLYDWYLDSSGNLNRWQRGQVTPPGQPTVPGTPRSPKATVSGTTVTVTWTLPASNGGSPLTAMIVTQQGGATHTLAASATSDTFTVSGGGPWTFNIVAENIVGDSPAAAAVASTSSTAYRFPGDTLPLKTGMVLAGASEADDDGSTVKSGWEWFAPEADTGVPYGAIKVFFQGGSVQNCFLPDVTNNATIAFAMKKHRAKGRMILANVAIQQSTSSHFTTWRAAGNFSDSVVHDTYYNFIQWCEEGADVPDCPVWVCMPHEAQQTSKVSSVTSSGMLPGDYGDMQWCFRQCMDQYALSKVGGADPTVYKWKRLAFGGIHVGDVFGLPSSNIRNIDGFYTSYANGGAALAKRVHDFVGGDPYQVPISGSTAVGRTGTPGWSTNMTGMCNWCKAKGYPIVFGEYGVHNTDGDAGVQFEAWWNKVTSGTYDIVAAIYFHSAPNGPPLDPAGSGSGRWLFTNYMANNPTLGSNGGAGHVGMYTFWQQIMKNTVPNNPARSVHFWDVGSPGIPGGYSRPPGV